MARYLVTGGCGFIGSHLVGALRHGGHEVRVLDDLSTGRRENVSSDVEIVVGSIADFGTVAASLDEMEGVFHLAAISSVQKTQEDWLGCHAVNETGAINVLEAVRRTKRSIPVVYASSAAVYGDRGSASVTERSPVLPLSPYGADKLGCELHARLASHLYHVDTVGLRMFNVYGPGQEASSPYSGVLAIFLDRLKRGMPVDVHGDGEQVRDFVYVGDVVPFFLAAMAKSASLAGHVLNVCTGRGTSIRTLAETIGRAYGVTPTIGFSPRRNGDIQRSVGNPNLARRTLRCVASTEVSEGLSAMIAADDRDDEDGPVPLIHRMA
jgi:UDP-glucose 4-epimerase